MKKQEQKPYVYQPYPKWLYHESGESKAVHSKDEHEKHMSDGWKESPADFEGLEVRECLDTKDEKVIELPKRRGRPAKAKE